MVCPMKNALCHIETWVFDLDHTLYPPDMCLFKQIETRMTDYIVDLLDVRRSDADALRAQYWQDFGTTLAGLMAQHQIDPIPFLTMVHDIDFSCLQPDPSLARRIAALPGRKIIYTNGTADYATNVIYHRGLYGLFDAIYGIEHAAFHPKPQPEAYQQVFELDGLRPETAAMFEDTPRNLVVPHQMGLQTILIAPHATPAAHIGFHATDLSDFLAQVMA